MFQPTFLNNNAFSRVLKEMNPHWQMVFQKSEIAEDDYLTKYLFVYFYQGAVNASYIQPNIEFEIMTSFCLKQHINQHSNDPDKTIKMLEDAVDAMFKKIKININSNDAKAFKQSVINLAYQYQILTPKYQSNLQNK